MAQHRPTREGAVLQVMCGSFFPTAGTRNAGPGEPQPATAFLEIFHNSTSQPFFPLGPRTEHASTTKMLANVKAAAHPVSVWWPS